MDMDRKNGELDGVKTPSVLCTPCSLFLTWLLLRVRKLVGRQIYPPLEAPTVCQYCARNWWRWMVQKIFSSAFFSAGWLEVLFVF